MSIIIKVFKCIFIVLLPIFILTLVLYIFIGTTIYVSNTSNDLYNSKTDVIKNFKNSITELKVLVNDLYNNYGEHYKYLTIENKQKKVFEDSLFYDKEVANKLFSDLMINYIYCDFENNRISFSIVTNYSASSIEIYYDTNELNSYLYNDNNIQDKIISMNNWRICIYHENPHFGWYTEQICSNWFYAENYVEGFNAMKYIKDDLKVNGVYNDVIEWLNLAQSEWHTKHFKK